MAKVDALLEALVTHATRHGGAQDVIDAWDEYQGNPTNEERAQAAADEEAAAQEKGKAANKKQVDEASKPPSDGTEDDNGEGE